MLQKYRYMPICPHCGQVHLGIYEFEARIKEPTRVLGCGICIHCNQKFTEHDIIYPGKELFEGYEQIIEQMKTDERARAEWIKVRNNLQMRCGILYPSQDHLMNGVSDVSNKLHVSFEWKWNELLIRPKYTLVFKYNKTEYEIPAPMQDDNYLEYLSVYNKLARRAVDEYLGCNSKLNLSGGE